MSQSAASPQHRSNGAAWLWAAPLAFLALFFFYPLLTVFKTGLESLQADSLTSVVGMIGRPLGFTLYQAALSTLLTLAVGLPGAYLFAHFTFPGKKLLRALTSVPFILPTVVVAAGFNALLGPRGWGNLALMGLFHLSTPPIAFLNTFTAILTAHVFYNTTIVLRTVGGAWESLDPRYAQAAQVLGAGRWRTFKEITLPLLAPSLWAAALLVFLFDFTSFGVILMLGGPHFATLEVEIYIQTLEMLNLPLAGLLSLIQLACTLVITGIYSRAITRGIVPLSPRLAQDNQVKPKNLRQRLLVGLLAVLLVVFLVSPLAALAARSVTRLDADRGQTVVQTGLTLDFYKELFVNRQATLFYVPPIEAVKNSLLYACATVLISVSLGMLAASALVRGSRLNRWLDPLLMLPLGASAVTLGLGFILAFSKSPLNLRASPLLVPLAHSLVAIPFVVRSLQPALGSIPNGLRQAASVLGAAPLRVWREVDLPIVARAVLASAIYAFTISLGEFGATSFLARPDYPTIPIAIYRFLAQPGALNYGQALAMATILMGLCAAGILLIERIRLPGD